MWLSLCLLHSLYNTALHANNFHSPMVIINLISIIIVFDLGFSESLVKCTNCLRSVHFNNCYNEVKLKKVVGDTEEERSTATCHWCDSFDFLRLDEYAMARFSRQSVNSIKKISFKTFHFKMVVSMPSCEK